MTPDFPTSSRQDGRESALTAGPSNGSSSFDVGAMERLLAGVEGWCTQHKARTLFEFACQSDCMLAVEIGVFGGKSLLPIASAFQQKKAGIIFGVEPWDNDVAIETATNAENDKWWKEIDMVAIKRGFLERIREHALERYVRLLEIPSDAIIQVFQSPRYNQKVDLVHVDGAHSTDQSVFDVAVWLRLLRPKGYLVLDDTNWVSVTIAFEYLKAVADLVYLSSCDTDGHFAVFKKR